MGKIILYIASSLDGYIAKENGSVGWLPKIDSFFYDQFYKTINSVILGNNTYQQVLTFGEYPYKDKKSYVFTRNKNQTNHDNVEFVSNIDSFECDILPILNGNVWLVGGSQIISSFVNYDIVDEIILYVIPILLGKGIPLFANIQKEISLELIKTTNHNNLTELHYKVQKNTRRKQK